MFFTFICVKNYTKKIKLRNPQNQRLSCVENKKNENKSFATMMTWIALTKLIWILYIYIHRINCLMAGKRKVCDRERNSREIYVTVQRGNNCQWHWEQKMRRVSFCFKFLLAFLLQIQFSISPQIYGQVLINFPDYYSLLQNIPVWQRCLRNDFDCPCNRKLSRMMDWYCLLPLFF